VIERLGQRIGRRGAALLFFFLLDAMWAFALCNPPHPLTPAYTWPAAVAPLEVWAGAWLAVGLVCLVYAFMRHDTPAFTAAVTIKVLWGGVLVIGWATGQAERGYVTATIWLAFAAFVYLIAGGIPAPPIRPEKVRRWKRS
jgi:hypothetical protein